ncbi:MAG: YihY/virulence factor BrkB family protein [Candidatus Glassbacteria bacterium]
MSNLKAFYRHYLGGLSSRIGEYHILLLGGGLSFSVFICIVPLVLVIISALGSFLEASSVQRQVGNFIDTVIPYPQYADYVKNIIFSRIDEVIAHKKIAGYLGVLGLFVAASSLFSSMRTVLNTIFGMAGGKPLVIGKLRDLGMVLLVLSFFLISTTFLPFLEIIKESAEKFEFVRYMKVYALQKGPFPIVSLFVVLLIFFILYYFIPYESIGKKVAFVSAFWATVLWEVARQVFGYYIVNFGAPGRIFGTYVVVVMVVFWIYCSAVVFIIGAEIGQLYRERSGKVKEQEVSQ